MGGGPSSTAKPLTSDGDEDYSSFWDEAQSGEGGEAGTKVLRGIDAIRGEIPHQVSLQTHILGSNSTSQVNYAHFCGASIIFPALLLTAAHCITDLNLTANQIRAVAGKHQLNVPDEGEQMRNVSRIILHPSWNANSTTYDNDIAILVLEKHFRFDNYTKSIALAKGTETWKEKAKVSGWGLTSERDRSPANTHQVAQITFIDGETCRQFYTRTNGKNVTENMLCAGGKRHDACKGDSGGPLTCNEISSDQTFLCGVVSWGDSKCVGYGKPGVYTKVSNYYHWIRKYRRIREYTWIRRLRSQNPIKPELMDSGISEMGNPWPDMNNLHGNIYELVDKMLTTNASYGELQHTAYLYQEVSTGRLSCSAAIVHSLLLLTSAQCALSFPLKETMVEAGMFRLRNLRATKQERNVRQVIVHEDFDRQTWVNNIGLIVLDEPLWFDDFTRPIEISDENKSQKHGALLASSFSTERYRDLPRLDVIARIPANLVGWHRCGFVRGIVNVLKGKRKTLFVEVNENYCLGPGHPLVCEGAKGDSRYLCGVNSVNGGCIAGKGYGSPYVFTDVSQYYRWIKSHMETIWRRYQTSILGVEIERREDCGQGNFRCPNNGICIPLDFRCDGVYDCDPLVDWDERNCTTP